MAASYDVAGIGNAIVDIIAPASDEFLAERGLPKGGWTPSSLEQVGRLYADMAPGVEVSGGSAANSMAGLASLGGRGAFIGKVAKDPLGEVFAHDIRAAGAAFDTPPLTEGPATGRCLINVTPDGARTMNTYLGAANELSAEDVDPAIIAAAEVVYLEGYLFDVAKARGAFRKAVDAARAAGRRTAITLAETFLVETWRGDLLEFIDSGVDIVFCNEHEAMALFQCELNDAVNALRQRTQIAAVTRGAAGSVIVSGDQTVEVPADPIDRVVDTTGAGDQYAAGFLFGLSHGRSLEDCARFGSMSAAEVISHYGPRPQTSLAELARAKGLL